MYFLFGALVGAAIFFLYVRYLERNAEAMRELQSSFTQYDQNRSIILAEATVADDLFPATADIDLDGAKISIVGGDGNYITLANGEKLKSGLEDWCARGASIKYLLACPTFEAVKEYRKLEASIDGRLELIFDKSRACDKALETLHPTLFELKSGKCAMWIESEHPKNSMVAYGVKYVSPDAMDNEPECRSMYRRFSKQFDGIIAALQAA